MRLPPPPPLLAGEHANFQSLQSSHPPPSNQQPPIQSLNVNPHGSVGLKHFSNEASDYIPAQQTIGSIPPLRARMQFLAAGNLPSPNGNRLGGVHLRVPTSGQGNTLHIEPSQTNMNAHGMCPGQPINNFTPPFYLQPSNPGEVNQHTFILRGSAPPHALPPCAPYAGRPPIPFGCAPPQFTQPFAGPPFPPGFSPQQAQDPSPPGIQVQPPHGLNHLPLNSQAERAPQQQLNQHSVPIQHTHANFSSTVGLSSEQPWCQDLSSHTLARQCNQLVNEHNADQTHMQDLCSQESPDLDQKLSKDGKRKSRWDTNLDEQAVTGEDASNLLAEAPISNMEQQGQEEVPKHSSNEPAPWISKVSNQSREPKTIEEEVQQAVFHEQETELQKVISQQRGQEMEERDILSVRHDSSNLKEKLLKMTSDHRLEMANKRGKYAHHQGQGRKQEGDYYSLQRSKEQKGKGISKFVTDLMELQEDESTKLNRALGKIRD
ncbi:hypothetical protein L7F22_002351 [Adiantum nelumboides]|nr:hypothetical protein [Adiantum nelumboides]